MVDSSDSNWIRIGGYLIVAGLALFAGSRERDRVSFEDGAWPPFWSMTAGFLVVMAIGRAGGIGDLVADIGRDEAVTSGWYANRRPIQAAVVGAVGLGWLIAVSVACWRTPERRRRYLPFGLAVVTIAAFAAIRIVSLHQVDAVLYRRHIAGVRIGTMTEIGLLTIAALVTLWVPRRRDDRADELAGRWSVVGKS